MKSSSSIKFFDTLETICVSGEKINWDGHDLQLDIPDGALPKGIVPKISFGVSICGNFHLPPSMKLVSAVFVVDVTPSSCFMKDVELRIPHCLDMSVQLCDCVSFVHAPFDKLCQTTSFSFTKLSGGVFKPNSEYGSICTRDFCLIAVAVDIEGQNKHQRATTTPLHALTSSDLPVTPVKLLPQQPTNDCSKKTTPVQLFPQQPTYKMTAYFCIPASPADPEWDVYFMVSLRIPSIAKVIH